MKRRNFIKKSITAGSATVAAASFGFPVIASSIPGKKFRNLDKYHFNLDYAPHFGMFEDLAGKDLTDQIKFMSDVGFRAMEDNGMMKRSEDVQKKIAAEMERLGMRMGVFVIDGGDNWKVSLTTGKPEFRETFLRTCREAVGVAKRCNATWMTVVPGYFDLTREMGYQTASVIDCYRRGAEIFESLNLVMVMEPLSDNPDLFLRTSSQGYLICKAVNSPACKILYDIYHMQRNEGDLISHIDRAWEEIGYVQIGDNPGRKEPTTGEINYKNIFKHLYDKGYKGILGMEHGIAGEGDAGEKALIEAYKKVDSFK